LERHYSKIFDLRLKYFNNHHGRKGFFTKKNKIGLTAFFAEKAEISNNGGVMPDLLFDNTKILYKYKAPTYKVTYAVYHNPTPAEKGGELDTIKSVTTKGYKKDISSNSACFASLPGMLSARKGTETAPNRVIYYADSCYHPSADSHLSQLAIRQYVKLCAEHRLLPRYAAKHLYRAHYLILRTDNLSLSKIYLYLTMARYISEEPFTVKTTLYFHNKGVNFYLALLMAVASCGNNSGHSVFPISKSYGGYGANDFDINKQTFKVDHARQLRAFVEKQIADGAKIKNTTDRQYFRLHSDLELAAKDTGKRVHAKNMADEDVVKFVYS
jgi:hypothetical protein